MAKVHLTSVSKVFAEHHAVSDINLAVNEGEFLALLGPSGCGKSTLLRIIAGLERPTSGEINIGDRMVTRLQPKDRNIAMVFQNYALYPHLTIYENIAFPLRVQGVRGAAVDEKVQWAAGLVEIQRLLARKPRQTSGGERQRTALARALVRDPQVFLLDEPLSNLDAMLRHSAREELREFQDRVGVTAIYVTHDQVEAMGLGDRIAVMKDGSIRQIGTAEEIYTEPNDTFVASFIGAPPMNLVPGPSETLGFRPEKFLPASSFAPGAELLRIAFRLKRTEYLGSDRLFYGIIENLGAPTAAIARLPAGEPIAYGPGEVAHFAVLTHDVRRFDAATGMALAASSGDLPRAANG